MSISYRIVENLCYFINKLPGRGVKGLMMDGEGKLGDKDELPRYMKKNGLKARSFLLDGFYIHRIVSEKAIRHPEKAVIFFPGGGGMARATWLHYDTARRIAHNTGADIYIIGYPLAPKHNVRYALKWSEKAYSIFIRKYKSENIVFMGDSAGANLLLSLTQRLDMKPGKLIVISPACGLEDGRNRNIRLAMESYDPILSVEMNDIIAENWCRNVPLNSPDISPEYIDYTSFPKMYFFYGKHELFYPHAMNFLLSLMEKEVCFTQYVKPMCHDWALCSFFPEGREAINRICRIVLEN